MGFRGLTRRSSVKGPVGSHVRKHQPQKKSLQHRGLRIEQFEDRMLLSITPSLIAVVTSDTTYSPTPSTTPKLNTAPTEFTLRFTDDPTQPVNASTLSGIVITRAGGDGKFYDATTNPDDINDVVITPGYIGIGDSTNEVVVRFSENLPQDLYQITIVGDAAGYQASDRKTVTPLRFASGTLFNGGQNVSWPFKLDLAPQVTSVVPQPTSAADGRNTIMVYFSAGDEMQRDDKGQLDPNLFQLIATGDTANSNDDSWTTPSEVDYTFNATTGVNQAKLVFSNITVHHGDGSADTTKTITDLSDFATGSLRLRIGDKYALTSTKQLITEDTETADTVGSSYNTALNLSTLLTSPTNTTGSLAGDSSVTSQTVMLDGAISPIAYGMEFPGDTDEPGHRELPDSLGESGENHVSSVDNSATGTIDTYTYTFPTTYVNYDGTTLNNVISASQKEAVRNMLSLFNYYCGVQFREVTTANGSNASADMSIILGDTRALGAPAGEGDVGGVATVGPGYVVVDAADYLNDTGAEGGGFWTVMMHELLHNMGLTHAYDIVGSVMGGGESTASTLSTDTVYPSGDDITHMQLVHRPDSIDIDLYKFTLDKAGVFSAETIANRAVLDSGLTSLLDTVITVYDANHNVVARNDDYYGNDSFVTLNLPAGTYYIGISAKGNDVYDPSITNSGVGGTTQGAYKLNLTFTPTATDTLTDTTGQTLDGDLDGKAGGTYDYWFTSAAKNYTLMVDKTANPSTADGTAEHPYATIRAAFDAARALTAANPAADVVVRVVGNNLANDFGGNAIYAIDTLGNDINGGSANLNGQTFSISDGKLTVKFEFDSDGSWSSGNVPISFKASDDADTLYAAIVKAINNPATNPGATPYGLYAKAETVVVNSHRVIVFKGPNVAFTAGTGTKASPFVSTLTDNVAYEIGCDQYGRPLSDGDSITGNLEVPKNVTLMIDAGAVMKLYGANVNVGSSKQGVDQSKGALQVLGTPSASVYFTSFLDKSVGTNTYTGGSTAAAGNWGGLAFFNSEDYDEGRVVLEKEGVFLNYINHADIRYGGGSVTVGSVSQAYSSIYMDEARPTITFNKIKSSADAAMSADPNSFEESSFRGVNGGADSLYSADYTRVGPEIWGNVLAKNTTNGIAVRCQNAAGQATGTLDVSARFDDTDIVHVISSNLIISGDAGGSLLTEGTCSLAQSQTNQLMTFAGSTISDGDYFSIGGTTYEFTNITLGIAFNHNFRTGDTLTLSYYDGATVKTRVFEFTADLKTLADTSHVAVQFGKTDAEGQVTPYEIDEIAQNLIDAINNDLVLQAAGVCASVPSNVSVSGVSLVSLSGIAAQPVFATTYMPGLLIQGSYTVTDGRKPIVVSSSDTAAVVATSVAKAINYNNAKASDTHVATASQNFVTISGSALKFTGLTTTDARTNGRLAIDPGVIVKLDGSRIETESGAQLIAEGTPTQPVILTSLNDDTVGAGGTFDTSNNGKTTATAGDWSSLYFEATSTASIDNAIVSYGGGISPIEGDYANFDVVEIHQATVRIADTVFHDNAALSGAGSTDANRNGRGIIRPAVIYVVGAQPVIVDNTFVHNTAVNTSVTSEPEAVISIDCNSLTADSIVDWGRSTGFITLNASGSNSTRPYLGFGDYAGNYGPVVRGNIIEDNGINGMVVRGGTLTTETIWDDTDIVHVLYDEIVVPNFHTEGGIRLQSSPTASLVVKCYGDDAGLTASGTTQEINDRIGGTVQIIGCAGYPVVMTSLLDKSVGAGFDLSGKTQYNTANLASDSAAKAQAGDWRGIVLEQLSNDRNVGTAIETETTLNNNDIISRAQQLGSLTSTLTGGDENLRLGFEVHGNIDTPTDVDLYSFNVTAGSEVWINIDKTLLSLDTVVELVDASGKVLARSDNKVDEESDATLYQTELAGNIARNPYDTGWTIRDYYSINPRDAGMRLYLPGAAGTTQTYYVRVYSAVALTLDNAALNWGHAGQLADGDTFEITDGNGTTKTFEFDSNGTIQSGHVAVSFTTGDSRSTINASIIAAINGVAGFKCTAQLTSDNTISLRGGGINVSSGMSPVSVVGATTGSYRLQVRLQATDEVPGSEIHLANLYYATDAITMVGFPVNSPLLLEVNSAELDGTIDTTFENAQNLGDLLSSNLGTLGVSGYINSPTNVNWYKFTVDLTGVQRIAGVSGTGSEWSTVFDIDYADGLSRPDLTIWIFDSTGTLILKSTNSNVADDQSTSSSDLSSGSYGLLDPYVGPAFLPEAGKMYYVAVSGPGVTSSELASDPLVRVEPAESVSRIVEEHINAVSLAGGPPAVISHTSSDSIGLGLTAVDFNLGDVVMYANTTSDLYTYDPLTGAQETDVTDTGGTNVLPNALAKSAYTYNDIAMRDDGALYAMIKAATGENIYAQLSTSDARTLLSSKTLGITTSQVVWDNTATPPTAKLDAYKAGITINAITEAHNTTTGERFVWAIGSINGTFDDGVNKSATRTNMLFLLSADGTPIQYPGLKPDGTAYSTDARIGTNYVPYAVLTTTDPTASITGLAIVTDSVTGKDVLCAVDDKGIVYRVKDLDPTAATLGTVADKGNWGCEAVDGDPNAADSLAKLNSWKTLTTGPSLVSVGAVPKASFTGLTRGPQHVEDDSTLVVGDGATVNGSKFTITDLNGVSFTFTYTTAAATAATDIVVDPADKPDVVATKTVAAILAATAPTTSPLSTQKLAVGASVVDGTARISVTKFDSLTIVSGNGVSMSGAYVATLFATDSSGVLYAINPFATSSAGLQQTIFKDSKNAPSSTVTLTGLGAAAGVAFSTLDYNLWHATNTRGQEEGHGIYTTYDSTRSTLDGSNYKRSDPTNQANGLTSFYFGLENPTLTTALTGPVTPSDQPDAANYSSNSSVYGTYDLPGGAKGSLVTQTPFSLKGYTAADLPRLYFNYYLATGSSDTLDGARVYISTDGGVTWSVIASNTNFGSDAFKKQVTDNGGVQLISNSGTWRQAVIDLGDYVGQDNLLLRFDFNTASDSELGTKELTGTTMQALAGNQIDDGTLFALTNGDTKEIYEFDMGVSITIPNGGGAAIPDGERFTVTDQKGNKKTFEFDSDGTPVDSSNIRITIDASMTAQDVAKLVEAAITSSGLALSPTVSTERMASAGVYGAYAIPSIPKVPDNDDYAMLGYPAGSILPGYEGRTATEGATVGVMIAGAASVQVDRAPGIYYTTVTVQKDIDLPDLSSFAALGIKLPFTITRIPYLPSDTAETIAARIAMAIDGVSSADQATSVKVDGCTLSIYGRTVSSSTVLAYSNSLQGDHISDTPTYSYPGANVVSDRYTSFVRGQDNAHAGFYIDDIIVGFAERGELVTNAKANTSFTTVDFDPLKQISTGYYQLEIREASSYGTYPNGNKPYYAQIDNTIDTNDRLCDGINLTIPAGNAIHNLDTFQVNDGRSVLTFQFVARYYASYPTNPSLNNWLNTSGANTDYISIYYTGKETPGQMAQLVAKAINDATTAFGDFGVSARVNADNLSESWMGTWTTADVVVTGATTAAYKSLYVPSGADLLPTDDAQYTFSVYDGVKTTTFTFWNAFSTKATYREPANGIGISASYTSAQVAQAIANAINNANLAIKAVASAGLVTIDGGDVPCNWFVAGTAPLSVSLGIKVFDGIGDKNTTRVQGQVIVDSCQILHSENYGIVVVAGDRNTSTSFSYPGAAAALLTGNLTSRLAPGVSLINNVIAFGGDGGIHINGDELITPSYTAATMFVHVINNTIYGNGPTSGDTGVLIENTAAATLLNNVIANLGQGIYADSSSSSLVVVGESAYWNNGKNAWGPGKDGSFALRLRVGDPLFVDPSNDNFYPKEGSPIIDSSLNWLADRSELTSVRSKLGIPQSPIVAPATDLYGQLRIDDPDVASASGLGQNVFKDRGAIDRVDFLGPIATLAEPVDGGSEDSDSNPNMVTLVGDTPSKFSIQLSDGTGTGIDDSTVTPSAVHVFCDYAKLTLGVDYLFRYNATTKVIDLIPTPGTWFPLHIYTIVLDNTIKDRAGEALQPNQTDLTTTFTIIAAQPLSVTSITPVTPDPRNTAVAYVDVTVSGVLDMTTLLAATTLNGTSLASATGVTVTQPSPGFTYRISGLTSLTGTEGHYRIEVDGAKLKDTAGAVGSGTASDRWFMDLTGATVLSIGDVLPDLRMTAVSSVDVTFSEPISTLPSRIAADAVVLTYTSLGVTTTKDLGDTLTFAEASGNTFTISGLDAYTSAQGTYTITINGSGVQDLAGNSGSGSVSVSWTVDTTSPRVVDVVDVTPDPRTTPVPSIDVTFSEAIDLTSIGATTFVLSYESASGATSTTNVGSSVTIAPVSGTTSTYRISGLDAFTGMEGTYTFAVNATRLKDVAGNTGAGSASDTWVEDLTNPSVTDVVDITPDPRNTAVSSVDVVFSELIDVNKSAIASDAIVLTYKALDGKIITTTLGAPLVTVAQQSGNTFRISGLDTYTAAEGTYTLTVNGSGIHDLAGNVGSGSAVDTWVVDLTAPEVLDVVDVTPDPRNTAVSSIDVVFSEAIDPSTLLAASSVNGKSLGLATDLTVTQLAGYTYRISAPNAYTIATGTYTFTVDGTLVKDLAGNSGKGTASDEWYTDTTPPTVVDIVDVTPDPRNTSVSSIDVTFSEEIKESMLLAATSLNGTSLGSIAGLTVTKQSDFTYRISGLESLTTDANTHTLTVDASKVEDMYANAGVGSASDTWVMDLQSPAVLDVVDVTPDPRNALVSSIDVVFSEAIDISTILAACSLNGKPLASSSGLSVANQSDFTYRISGLDSLTNVTKAYTFVVDGTAVKDLAGNLGTGSASDSWTTDVTPPEVTAFGETKSPRNTALATVDVTFSEPINLSSFTYQDISLTHNLAKVSLNSTVTVALVSGTTTTYRVSGLDSFTKDDGDYKLTVNTSGINDVLGNAGVESEFTEWKMDTGRLTISKIVPVDPDPRNLKVSTIDVEFPKAVDPLTFTYQDIVLTRNGTTVKLDSKVTVDPVSGSNDKTFEIAGLDTFTTADGTYVLTVEASGIKDAAGNAGSGSASDTWVLDKTAPTITDVVDVSPDPRNTSVACVDVTFSEKIKLNTFTAADVTLTVGGKAVDLSGAIMSYVSGTTYRIGSLSTLTGASGDYVLTVNAAAIEDIAGNTGTGTAFDTWKMDTVAPKVESISKSDMDPTNATAVHYVVTFSEAITGVDASDFSLITSGVTGARVTTVVAADSKDADSKNTVYNVTVTTGTGNGTLQLNVIDDDSITDSASNPLGGLGTGETGNGSSVGEVYTISKTDLPSIVVEGLGVAIADGDITPSAADGTNFGSVGQGTTVTRTFTVRNSGTGVLTIMNTPVCPSGFTLVNPPKESTPITIAAGATTTFTVQLLTETVGTFTGDISFATNQATVGVFTFRVTGSVTAPVATGTVTVEGLHTTIADGDMTPSTSDGTDFDNVDQGAAGRTRTFTVRNTGEGTLTLGTPTLPTGYSLVEGLSTTLAAGASDTFTVQLATATAGTFAGEISFATSDTERNPFNFRVTGTVVATPQPSVAVQGLGQTIADGDSTPSTTDGTDFGTAEQGDLVTRMFTVRNNGNAALVLGTPTLPSGFTLVEPLSTSIAAGGSDTFTVQMTTTAAGTFAGDISFSTNDSTKPMFNFKVSGSVAASSDAFSSIGLFNPTSSAFYLRNTNDTGYADSAFGFGPANANWTAISGDWNGDGVDTIGLYDPKTATFFLNNSNTSGNADATFNYGPANLGWVPVVGDWNGDGVDTIGLYNPTTSTFFLRNANDSGYADAMVSFGAGNLGWKPVTGDWNGDGVDTIGLYLPQTSSFFLSNSNVSGAADVAFSFGAGGSWTPLVGDWNSDGADTIGLYQSSSSAFYLRNANSSGYADVAFGFGPANAGWTPVTGDWTGITESLVAAEGAVAPSNTLSLTGSQVQAVVNAAIERLIDAGLSASDAAKLADVHVTIADLAGSRLGESRGNDIVLDIDAAGHGWFADSTPYADEEFHASSNSKHLDAIDANAVDRIDLLTVVEHELGHVAGLDDLDSLADSLMSDSLKSGVRRLP